MGVIMRHNRREFLILAASVAALLKSPTRSLGKDELPEPDPRAAGLLPAGGIRATSVRTV